MTHNPMTVVTHVARDVFQTIVPDTLRKGNPFIEGLRALADWIDLESRHCSFVLDSHDFENAFPRICVITVIVRPLTDENVIERFFIRY